MQSTSKDVVQTIMNTLSLIGSGENSMSLDVKTTHEEAKYESGR